MPNDKAASHHALVLTTLSRHIGKGNGISVKQLAQQTSLSPRVLRHHISDLREDGQAVCGTPKDGYYIAATAEELEETCRFIRRRSLHGLRMESQMRKIPLTDLLGQLHLPT
jgi:DNA-binding transcriptional ArsR family regulator